MSPAVRLAIAMERAWEAGFPDLCAALQVLVAQMVTEAKAAKGGSQ